MKKIKEMKRKEIIKDMGVAGIIRNAKIKRTSLTVCVIFIGLFVYGCGTGKGIDYGKTENWAVFETDTEDKAADVFFIAPTATDTPELGNNMNMADEKCKGKFRSVVLMQKGIYDDNARFFAPYFRRANFDSYNLPENELEQALQIAYEDVSDAFEYYLANCNEGRPIVLAGFSQGSDMLKRLMFEYGNDERLKNRLVAAYMIGWNITDEELEKYSYIKMASGETDTGVVVSFCSESPEIDSSIVVPVSTNGINPLNWKCDNTPAEKTLNLGACFMDGNGEITEEIPQLTGAYLDSERGTLKITDVTSEEYPAKVCVLEDGNFHYYDYMFFYRNLEKNVQERIKQFLTLDKIKKGDFSLDTFVGKLRFDNEKSEEDDKSYINYAPGVTSEMCTAEYWLERKNNIDKVILDESGIADFNASMPLNTKSTESYGHYVGETRAKTLNKDELSSLINVFIVPAKDTDYFYADGTPVEAEVFDNALALRNLEGIGASNPVRYGIALDSVGIRKIPIDVEMGLTADYDYCDEMQNSSVRMNEPLIVLWESTDRKWYFVATKFCLGWISAESVGVTDDYEYFCECIDPSEFLVVLDNYSYLDFDPSNAKIASRRIDMGTKIALVTDGSFETNNYGRYATNNYLIKLPSRDDMGKLYYENAYLPENVDANIGYLDFTQRNVIELAFKAVGDQYGWAGLYDNRDCSQYMKEIYRCFGIDLPRTTATMLTIPWSSLNVTDLSGERKEEILDNMPAGTLLVFPGHVMMYLGKTGDEYYCISACGSAKLVDSGELLRIRSVMVNSLNSSLRGNGRTWLDSITAIKLPY